MASEAKMFPLGIATGRAHCNRASEREELAGNVLDGVHTWIWARRRIGKTSLIQQVLHDLQTQVISGQLDLLVIHDALEFHARIKACVEQVGAQMAPGPHSSTRKLARAFAALKPEFSVGTLGLNLKLSPPKAAGEGIAELLLALDAAAAGHRRRVVLVLDEFQQLGQLHNGAPRSLEGTVRHAVERAQNVTYIFSGSQKHLLASMFEDADRPLYKLCRKMTLQRISAEDYEAFLIRAGRRRWRRKVPAAAIQRILALTARHPHYLNALCAALWRAEAPPTEGAVETVWRRLVEEEGSLAAGAVARLAPSQRALLRAVAAERNGVAQPTSRAFLSQIRLPVSTGVRARESLEREDLLQQDTDGRWTLVDPALAAWLRRM